MRLPFLAALALLVAAPALAGPASERIFYRDALTMIEAPSQAIYRHQRGGTSGTALNPISDGEIRVTLQTATDGTREAAVSMGRAGKLRPVSVFPATSGNPILPIFLESTLRTMARVTGGSEIYIRNRIKDAFGSGGTIENVSLNVNGSTLEGQHIVFEPFLNDKHRDRMGEFASLTLHFIVSKELPGDIHNFLATTSGGDNAAYREEISFLKLTGSE